MTKQMTSPPPTSTAKSMLPAEAERRELVMQQKIADYLLDRSKLIFAGAVLGGISVGRHI